MALTGLHINWEKGLYVDDRDWNLKKQENPGLENGTDLSGLRAYYDGSIAIGYGFDLLQNDNATINTYLTAANGTTTQLTDADIKLLDEARAKKKAGTATRTYLEGVKNQLSVSLVSEPAATSLLQIKLAIYETALDTALGGSDQLGNSKERIAVLSLLYTLTTPDATAISGKKGIPKTIAAIQNDNRAEAWFEIRYNSNADGQHAKRRYSEANLFGLTDSGTLTQEQKIAQAKEIMRMWTTHKDKITVYEKSYPPSVNDSATLQIQPIANYLASTFAPGQTIDNIIVGAGLDTYAYLEKTNINDTLNGTNQNDLIFGEKGNDTIYGWGGNDVIYGEAGNDTIYGGAGSDVLVGGSGIDTYIVEGSDRIIDSDGKGIVRDKNGQEITGIFIKQADGTYQWTNNTQVTATKNSPLTLYLPDGSTVVIENQANNGDFGIHLLDTPTEPQITNIIVGDLAPMDIDPITAGIQTGYDALGNLITGPNSEPNRADYLYDSAGNDRIEGKGGNDVINADKGGNDYLDGGLGDDIIQAGNGSDMLYGVGSIML